MTSFFKSKSADENWLSSNDSKDEEEDDYSPTPFGSQSPLYRGLRRSSSIIFGEEGRTRSSTVTLAMASVGSGVLALPGVVRKAGLFPGFIAIVLAATASWYSNEIVSDIVIRKGCTSYALVARAALGYRAYVAVELILVVLLVLILAAVLLVLGDALTSLFKGYADVCIQSQGPSSMCATFFQSREYMVLALLAAAIVPLSLLRDITSLRFTSLLGAFSIAYVLSTLCYGAALQIQSDGGFAITFAKLPAWGSFGWSTIEALPVIFLSFGAQIQLPIVVNAIKEPRSPVVSKAHIARRANFLATFGLFLIYSLFALGGNLCFPGRALLNGDILNEFASFGQMHVMVALARILMVVALTFNAPLICMPCRESLFRVVRRAWGRRNRKEWGAQNADVSLPHPLLPDASPAEAASNNERMTTAMLIGLTTAIYGSAFAMFAAFKRLDFIMTLSGSTAGIGCIYILPFVYRYVDVRNGVHKNRSLCYKIFLLATGTAFTLFGAVCTYRLLFP